MFKIANVHAYVIESEFSMLSRRVWIDLTIVMVAFRYPDRIRPNSGPDQIILGPENKYRTE